MTNKTIQDSNAPSHEATKLLDGAIADYELSKKVQKHMLEQDSKRWNDYLDRGSLIDTAV